MWRGPGKGITWDKKVQFVVTAKEVKNQFSGSLKIWVDILIYMYLHLLMYSYEPK